MEALHTEIFNLIAVVLVGCVGLATKAIMSYLKKKGFIAKIQGQQEVAKIVVNAVEQTYKHLHGEEKLNLAKIELLKMAQEKGLKISQKELDMLIEASVKEMNKAIKHELKK